MPLFTTVMNPAQNGAFPKVNLDIAYGNVNNTNVAAIIVHIIIALLDYLWVFETFFLLTFIMYVTRKYDKISHDNCYG